MKSHGWNSRLLMAPFLVLVAIAIWSGPARAYLTDDRFDMRLPTAGAASSSLFPGVPGTAPTNGIPSTSGSGIVTRLGTLTSSLPDDYAQTTIPHANELPALTGWVQSLDYGQQGDQVSHLRGPLDSPVTRPIPLTVWVLGVGFVCLVGAMTCPYSLYHPQG